MICLKLYFKKPTHQLYIIDAKVQDAKTLNVKCKIVTTEYYIFRKVVTENIYYSTLQGTLPIRSVDIETFEDTPAKHLEIISNYYYGEEFERVVYKKTPAREYSTPADVVKMERVK